MSKYTLIISYIMLCVFTPGLSRPVNADHFKVCIAQMPVGSVNKNEGTLIDLVKLWEKATGHQFTIEVYPFKRSLFNVSNKVCDCQLPLIINPLSTHDNSDFDYSTSTIMTVNFVLYTNKEYPIDVNHLEKYKIVTDAAHIDFFDFPITGDFKIESSLKKLSTHRIDGYIYTNITVDPVLIELGLKNIKRQFYKSFAVHAVLPKDEKGGGLDRIITDAMAKIKKNGSFDNLMKPYLLEYIDWQP